MPSRNDLPEGPKLSDMEWEVMKPLWEHGPMAARDIYERVPDTYGWAYETVKTMLARLVKKGALTYDQIGNSFLYRPAYTRAEMTREATGSFIQRVFDGALNPFLAHFAEQASHEELQAIRQELSRIEKMRREDK
ncbi:MAG: BlaI/MecI/CopY family transcriptional regulator [Candidatus Hydrogenedentales bacterium]